MSEIIGNDGKPIGRPEPQEQEENNIPRRVYGSAGGGKFIIKDVNDPAAIGNVYAAFFFEGRQCPPQFYAYTLMTHMARRLDEIASHLESIDVQQGKRK